MITKEDKTFWLLIKISAVFASMFSILVTSITNSPELGVITFLFMFIITLLIIDKITEE